MSSLLFNFNILKSILATISHRCSR